MKQTILAIDDEPHMLKLLERIITEQTAYATSTTSNSLEVPELLKQNVYDVILTDLKMPGLDGMDILRMVREEDRFEEVIIITAFGSMASVTEALSLGVFDYVTKPFKREQIIASIDRAMRWQRQKRERAHIEAMFGMEPFDKACESFEQEYIHRLSERCDGDQVEMARRSGLAPDRLRQFAQEQSDDIN
ncbi:MAG: response regulator [Candidatus Latescibacterota bacterium]|nr:MAG: response regulator [Candidatus Latescibacterota bacterium]